MLSAQSYRDTESGSRRGSSRSMAKPRWRDRVAIVFRDGKRISRYSREVGVDEDIEETRCLGACLVRRKYRKVGKSMKETNQENPKCSWG